MALGCGSLSNPTMQPSFFNRLFKLTAFPLFALHSVVRFILSKFILLLLLISFLTLEENKLWFGSFSHLTFCPPINTVDCPIHTFVTTTCPFKHNMYKNGQCIRWKAGQL